jgi:hypothetical protein
MVRDPNLIIYFTVSKSLYIIMNTFFILSVAFEVILRFLLHLFHTFLEKNMSFNLKMVFEVRDEFIFPNYSRTSRLFCLVPPTAGEKNLCDRCDVAHVPYLTIHYTLVNPFIFR